MSNGSPMRLPWPLLFAAEEDELLRSLVFAKKPDLEASRSYLIKERKPERGRAQFRRAIERGFRPLLITRQHPDHVDRRHANQDVRVIWLSTAVGKDYVDPHNLNSLTNLVTEFTGNAEPAVILIEAIEFLLENNEFARIIQFIEYVSEQVAIHRAIFLLSLDPRAFDRKELALIERNIVTLA